VTPLAAGSCLAPCEFDPTCVSPRLKCTKLDFRGGSAPDPDGELTALPRPLQLDLRGPTSKRSDSESGGYQGIRSFPRWLLSRMVFFRKDVSRKDFVNGRPNV